MGRIWSAQRVGHSENGVRCSRSLGRIDAPVIAARHRIAVTEPLDVALLNFAVLNMDHFDDELSKVYKRGPKRQ